MTTLTSDFISKISAPTFSAFWDLMNTSYIYGARTTVELQSLFETTQSGLTGELSPIFVAVGTACFLTAVGICSMCKTRRTVTRSRKRESESSKKRLLQLMKKACLPGCLETIMEEMNEKELDINERVSPSGLTYFLCGCLSGNADLIKFMIKLGCGVNKQNKRGFTPLHRAASKGNLKVIQYLLLEGADPYICNHAGVYPIDSATCAGHMEAARLLKLKLPNPYVWDVVEPHTPPHIKMGLQSPLRKPLLHSSRRPVLRNVFT